MSPSAPVSRAVPSAIPRAVRRPAIGIIATVGISLALASGCSRHDDAGGDAATTTTDAGSGGTEPPAASSSDAGGGSSTTGFVEVGELRIEILDPLRNASIMAEPAAESPGYFAAFYDVRAALRGEGGDEIAKLVAQSSGPFGGYYYADLVDGPDGRIATFYGMRIGGLHKAGDPPTQYGVQVTPELSAVPPPAEVVVTVVIPAL